MSDDGADLNIGAEDGMKAAMGGGDPQPMSDADFEQMVRTADKADSYDAAANCIARYILAHLEAHPEAATLDTFDLYNMAKDGAPEEIQRTAFDGCTGFMAGWAVNAARHILKLKPVPNPAIIKIG